MGRIYKSEETAIRNFERGVSFYRTVFSNYWNNKEIFLKFAKAGFVCSGYDKHKFTSWYSTWRWDEDFVTEIFDAQYMLCSQSKRWHELEWLVDSLPDSITSSPRYLQLCRECDHFGSRLTGEALLTYYTNVYDSKIDSDTKFRHLFKDHFDVVMKDSEDLESVIFHYEMVPPEFLKDRALCLNIVRHSEFLLCYLVPWLDDIDFAIECLEIYPKLHMYPFSYRIRNITHGRNIMSSLMKCKLETSLANKPLSKERKLIKI